MKRQAVELADLASPDNLQYALWRASKGKRQRADVQEFLLHVDSNLKRLQEKIIRAEIPTNCYRTFYIRDPKVRKIVVVSFETRVLHHAIMNLIAENLHRSQIHNSFACIPGRGVHAAAKKVQQCLRQNEVLVKIDIEKYFAHIDHSLLKNKLQRRFKGRGFLQLLDAIIDSFQEKPGKGLPIGSLSSQYFANLYLENFDRFIQSQYSGGRYLRYMDDMIWFCSSKEQARQTLKSAVHYLSNEGLTVKPQRQIQPCSNGVSYCGFRILPNRILLSRRKKRNFKKYLQERHRQYRDQEISALQLQKAYANIHSLTLPADAAAFRRKTLSTIQEIEA